jgi:hypothetical protein
VPPVDFPAQAPALRRPGLHRDINKPKPLPVVCRPAYSARRPAKPSHHRVAGGYGDYGRAIRAGLTRCQLRPVCALRQHQGDHRVWQKRSALYGRQPHPLATGSMLVPMPERHAAVLLKEVCRMLWLFNGYTAMKADGSIDRIVPKRTQ